MASLNFGTYLQHELDRRRRGNSRYTLRSFARALGIDHSSLSQLMRGRRRATRHVIETIGCRMRLDDERRRDFCAIEDDAAILAAVAHPRFQPQSRWLASQLNLPVDVVNIAIQRLLRRGALRMSAPDTWSVEEEANGAQSGDAMADRCEGS